ncbi:MAG: hypothetical protein MK226_05845 [Saprospiraceae bacterium]|nr:hypothetical protein [Saprospiraceae bacterium]
MIPATFEEWKNCIVNDCKIKLTPSFVASRLKVYKAKNHPETKAFESLYGEQHLNNVIYFLERSAKEIAQGNTI